MLNTPFPFEVEVVSYQTSARVIRGVLVLPPHGVGQTCHVAASKESVATYWI